MAISAYAIGNKVWLVSTETTAEDKVPATLPIGSIVLMPMEAWELAQQIDQAADEASKRSGKSLKPIKVR